MYDARVNDSLGRTVTPRLSPGEKEFVLPAGVMEAKDKAAIKFKRLIFMPLTCDARFKPRDARPLAVAFSARARAPRSPGAIASRATYST